MRKNIESGLDRNSRVASAPSYRNGLTYLLIGGGIGATLALLFAPKAGSQLRGSIADVTRKSYDAALDKARVLNEKSGDLAHTVREKADAVLSYASGKSSSGSADERRQTSVETSGNSAKNAEDREVFSRTSNVG